MTQGEKKTQGVNPELEVNFPTQGMCRYLEEAV